MGDVSRSPLDRHLVDAAGRHLLGALAVGGLVLLAAALGSAASVPRLHAAGGGAVALAVGAAIGTGATAVVPLATLVAAFAAGSQWSSRGGAAGAASLGIGPLRQFLGLAPLWAAGTLLVLVCAFAIEPAAWTGLHRVRGGPLTAAVGWASLQAGEVRTLGAGGAAVMRDGGLRATTATRAWDLEATAARPDPRGTSWHLDGVTLAADDGEVWTVDAVEVRLKEDRRARWLAPPSSPWTMGPRRLWGARSSSPKASLVLHRRLALASSVPLVAMAGWLLAWGEAPKRRRLPGLVAISGLALALFAVARTADRAVAEGMMGGGLAGWLPLLPAAVVAVVLGWRAR